jgi:endonuclease/exonuclease/phosphatase family metal-dependent hydrolase
MNHRGNDTTDGVRPDFRSLKQLLPTLRENIVLMGDFNNSVIWDTKKKNGSFCDTIELLREKDISRCYHEHYNEEFGSEARPTIYWRKSKETTYHIDYCFCSQPLLDRLSSVQVGEFETTKQFSDHVPLTFTFDF